MKLYLLICFFSLSVCSFALDRKCLSDTVVYYNIEGLSSEGAEEEVFYTSAGDIGSAKIRIYGCSGQSRIEMTFDKSHIKVKEKTYFYEKPLSEIESEEDIHLKSELEYTMDYNGNLLNKKPDLDHIDIFPVFRKVIPFKINRQYHDLPRSASCENYNIRRE